MQGTAAAEQPARLCRNVRLIGLSMSVHACSVFTATADEGLVGWDTYEYSRRAVRL
jgi:hypothetical protein